MQRLSPGGPPPRDLEIWSWPLPFMVLAVEQPVEDLAQRADVMQVVQDDDERHVYSIVLTGALVSKVGQVLAQFLQRPVEEQVGERTGDHACAQSLPIAGDQRTGKSPLRAVHPPATGGWFAAQGMQRGNRERKAWVLPLGIH